MRVKVCGITSVVDAAAAVHAGADAIGLNFVGGPRRIDAGVAREICKSLPPLITPVALVRVDGDELGEPGTAFLREAGIGCLQVYGEIRLSTLERLDGGGFRAVPVIAVRHERFAEDIQPWTTEPGAYRPRAVLLDAYDPSRAGGTGRPFRWDWVSAAREAGTLSDWPSIILAGGLDPDNVAQAIAVVRPFAVDVSSGVEVEGVPGKKDPEKMRLFVRRAKLAGGQER